MCDYVKDLSETLLPSKSKPKKPNSTVKQPLHFLILNSVLYHHNKFNNISICNLMFHN